MATSKLPPVSPRQAGKRLRDTRLSQGLTAADVARAVGRSASWVYRMERGEVPTSDIRLQSAATFLGLPSRALVTTSRSWGDDLPSLAEHKRTFVRWP